MKALVTGGTGFVGSHVVRELTEQGHSVRVLHRSSSRLDALAGLAYESAIGDITDEKSLHAASEGIDWVFHVAAVADYWRADVGRMFDANIEGTRRVLRAARAAGVQRVIFTSSAAAMGMRQRGAEPVDEHYRFNMSSAKFPYGYSKAMAEVAALEAVKTGQDVVIVNPVAVIGPGDLNVISGGFVINIAQLGWLVPVPPGGLALTDVRDIARWHVAAAERGISGERYLLGTENLPHAVLFAKIADLVGVPRPGLPIPSFLLPWMAMAIDLVRSAGIALPVDGNQTRLGGRFIYFSYDKAWSALGEPQFSIDASLRDTYAWYLEHGYIQPTALTPIMQALGRMGRFR